MSLPLRALRRQEDTSDIDVFRDDVLAGLRCKSKRIPYKYLYDERGSMLFEQICDLEEYYLTRTELSITEQHIKEIVDALGPRCLIIEYGSGSSRKTRLILDHLESPVGYVPIDISSEALARRLPVRAEDRRGSSHEPAGRGRTPTQRPRLASRSWAGL